MFYLLEEDGLQCRGRSFDGSQPSEACQSLSIVVVVKFLLGAIIRKRDLHRGQRDYDKRLRIVFFFAGKEYHVWNWTVSSFEKPVRDNSLVRERKGSKEAKETT